MKTCLGLRYPLHKYPYPVASKGSVSCNPNPLAGQTTAKVTCCQTTTYTDNTSVTYCTDCDDTKPPSNCGPRYVNPLGHEQGVTPTIPIPPPSAGFEQPPPPQPPKNALPPSQQQTTCPDGSTPDANGKCPITTTNQQVAPSQSLASNNNPQQGHHHKKGQDSTTKKDNDGGSQQQAPP